MNNCPYQDEQNEHLLCPADLLSPWNACEIEVKQVPESGLKTLEFTRKYLMMKKTELLNLQRDEMTQELRFRGGRMRLGVNKSSLSVGIGSVVMLQLDRLDRPELGVVTEMSQNECTVRLRNRSLTTTLAVLTPIALPMDGGKELKVMGDITHFISFEL